MNSVGDLKKRILLLLGDDIASAAGEPIYGGQYSDDALLAGVHAALDAILPWVWKRSVFELNSSSDGYQFNLPADFYQVEGVTESVLTSHNTRLHGRYAPLETFKAREIPDSNLNFWSLFPQGKITFSWKIDLAAGARMYYAATWEKPTNDATNLETPEYALTAISLYAASNCLLGKAVAAANIRQYGTKVDSGSPEDNPMLTASTYLQRVFEVAVQRLPVMPRGVIQ
jgi:hypothetical protein